MSDKNDYREVIIEKEREPGLSGTSFTKEAESESGSARTEEAGMSGTSVGRTDAGLESDPGKRGDSGHSGVPEQPPKTGSGSDSGQSDKNSGDKESSDREEVCYICHRTESVAGPMVRIQGHICICSDCMQKTFDSMSSMSSKNLGVWQPGNLLGFGFGGMPGLGMMNFGDFPSEGIPESQRLKKKKPKEKKKPRPVLDIRSIPVPHKIKAGLDEYIIGQEQAKKIVSVAVYNHYKRIMAEQSPDPEDDVEIGKSNMLMVGPTGCGKTYLVKTLARLLDVPLAITDATTLTEAGYIGDDIESVVSKLLAAADNDVERAEHGIIFIDEIDKIAKKRNTNQRDVSGESVQQGMLKLLEGAEIEVPVGASSKNAMVPMTIVDTKNILFICGGAFPDLEDIIKERLNKEASIGFIADLKDKHDKDENLLRQVTTEDVRKFGMIPEFLGRMPILFSLDALSEDMLVDILVKPKNAITRQYRKLLAMDEVRLEFEEEALHEIARRAKEKKVGARALRAILEEFMLDIMYEIPKDDNIGCVTITKDYLEHKGAPRIQMREVSLRKH